MPRGSNVEAQILKRIKDSVNTLTVHYPEARPVLTGNTPVTGPSSPLTGPVPTTTVYPGTPVPTSPAVTVSCLWLDSYSAMGKAANNMIVQAIGWKQGTDAVARVSIEDTALDSTVPLGDTIFTGASHVEFSGQDYDVVQIEPVASSFTVPATYHVWMKGAIKHSV